ncbi:MAG: TIGR01777 family oxidoreductase [Chitinophagales bacterium]
MKQILITGGSGPVGNQLTSMLIQLGYEVAHLSTRKNAKHPIAKVFHWDIEQQHIDTDCLENTIAIIHLAGASVAGKRWSDTHKKTIYDSRILSTKLLHDTLKSNKHKVQQFISTSATGYYGVNTAGILTEDSKNGNDFLAKVCRDWEKEAQVIESLEISTSIVRIGIVLSKNGGALKEMMQTFPFFGATIGNGQQIYPWIHIDDLCQIFIHLIKNKIEGTFNATAPKPVSQKAIIKAVKKEKYPIAPILPTPLFILNIVLGEMTAVVAGSQNCSSKKIQEHGFEFEYPTIEKAIKVILA